LIIEKALTNLESLKSRIPGWAVDAVKENSDLIINIIRGKQLSKGLDSNGSLIGRYQPSTEGYADRDNISTPKTPGSPYNLYWSGDTLENLYIKSVNKSQSTFNISTVASKKKLLESLYGEIFDLTEANNDLVNTTIIEPYIAKKIEENLFDF
jgi:hypothetical protein